MGWTIPSPLSNQFQADLRAMAAPEVLELGTLRWEPDRPTHHQEWHPGAARWVMSDVEPGMDVDVVADAHDLAPFADGSFDALVSYSLLEHVARPWLVLPAMARVLKPGGMLFVMTHQTFPLHGYPNDFFRFSADAMTVLAEDAGLEVVRVEYALPAKITPPRQVPVWDPSAATFLNVELYARKPS